MIDRLADEMREWFRNPDNWWIEEFATQKEIPYKYFTEDFPNKSPYWVETMDLCWSIQKVRFFKLVQEKRMPMGAGILGGRNILEWRDGRERTIEKKKHDQFNRQKLEELTRLRFPRAKKSG